MEPTQQANVELAFNPQFLEPEGALDEVNVDFDPLELPTELDDHWMSTDQETSAEVGGGPSASNWQPVPTDDASRLRVTVDKGRRFMWRRGKTEADILRKHWGENHPSFDTLCTRFFSKESELFLLFRGALNVDYETFCRFLATFYSASMLNVPATRLYKIQNYSTKGLMETKEDYVRILRLIEMVDNDNDGVEKLWMKVEYLFNRQMRETYLSKRGNADITIALDDDEVHYNYSKSANTYGLKRHRHIKDNRFGHTLHTAGYSATGVILQAVFEREGESSTDCYERIMKDMFGIGNGKPNLQGTTWCSDRGYWNVDLLFKMLLPWGADVVGTIKRSPWYPFTFSRLHSTNQSSDPHQRQEVSMKGYKDVFYRTLNWVGRKIRATCYRAGTGTAVSLAMSSIHHQPVFDLNLAFPKDHRWYYDTANVSQDERNEKAFPCICGTSNGNYEIVKELPIVPLTLVQGDAAWFILRMFSLTSSSVDRMITARASEITCCHDERENYETILAAVDRLNLLPSEDPVEDVESEDEAIEEGSAAPDGVVAAALNWMRRVDNGEQRTFLDSVDSLDEILLRAIVEQHENSKPTAPIASIRKQLKAWAACDHKLKRKYHWCTNKQLEARIKSIDPTAKTGRSFNKPKLFDLLIEVHEHRANVNAAIAAGEDPFIGEADPVLLQVFRTSFMKPLKEEAKKYCRQGHALERPFLRQFYAHSQQGLTKDYKALAIFETPLVQTSLLDLPESVCDSADAELVYSFCDSEPRSMPIEIKARLSHTTFYDERNRQEANLGLNAWEEDSPSYVVVEADSSDLFNWIPQNKESFQLMHHVAVRNLREGLLLVGSAKKIMFGIFVKYSDRLIQSYQSVLRDLSYRSLAQFYAPYEELEKHMPYEKIETILGTSPMKPIGLSIHAFKTSFYIWRRMRLEGDVDLPIPPCNRILPYNHSFWNNMKGASDTASHLMWNCQVHFGPYARSQTVAIGRFLQLYAISIHRQHHIASAKTDLNYYGSLYHFRNTRNRVWPFYDTVESLSRWLVDRANAPKENAFPTAFITQTPPRINRAIPRLPFEEERTYSTVCGGTPTKGKGKYPKNRGTQWQADQRRRKNCPGNLLFKVKDRQPCWLCGTQSYFWCAGCKSFYCMDNRFEKIRQLVLNNNEIVQFLDGVCPPATLNISSIAMDGKKAKCRSVEYGCYHITHKSVVSEAAACVISRAPLAPIDVSKAAAFQSKLKK